MAARVIAEARASDAQAEIENLKLKITKMRRDQYGAKSERRSKLLDQLAELEEAQVQP